MCMKDEICACILSYISFPLIDMQHDNILKKLIFARVRGQVQCHCDPKMVLILRHLKTHPHTKIGIPISINIENILRT